MAVEHYDDLIQEQIEKLGRSFMLETVLPHAEETNQSAQVNLEAELNKQGVAVKEFEGKFTNEQTGQVCSQIIQMLEAQCLETAKTRQEQNIKLNAYLQHQAEFKKLAR